MIYGKRQMWKVELIKIDFNLLCLLCSIFMKNSLLSSLNFVVKCQPQKRHGMPLFNLIFNQCSLPVFKIYESLISLLMWQWTFGARKLLFLFADHIEKSYCALLKANQKDIIFRWKWRSKRFLKKCVKTCSKAMMATFIQKCIFFIF